MDEDDVPPGSTPSGALSCPCVPTLRPSVEEWSDPLGYLASVRGRGELVGMVKVIVPGEGENAWEPKRYALVLGVLDVSAGLFRHEYVVLLVGVGGDVLIRPRDGRINVPVPCR